MASKKSPSPRATKKSPSPTATMSPPPASPAPTQSPVVSNLYRHQRRSVHTVETTPPPTSTTTLSPEPDPHEYEKSAYDAVSLTDCELEQLKEHVRLLKGLPLTQQRPLPRIATLRPPKVVPRGTLTSWRRAQLQQRRMVLSCGGLLKHKFDEYERLVGSSPEDSAQLYRRLRADAMEQTSEQTDSLLEQQELQNLKYLATQARRHESVEYRDNQVSRLRFKHIRGEPILSSNFRDAYDDYMKPPFTVAASRFRHAKARALPKIDKRKEIWLVPLEEDDTLPLLAQLKTPKPKEKRLRKERARPPVKKGAPKEKRTSSPKIKRGSKERPQPAATAKTGRRMSSQEESTEKTKRTKRKRPPWRFSEACPAHTGWA